MKNGQFLSNFNFRLICQLCLFIISTEHFNIWIVFFFLGSPVSLRTTILQSSMQCRGTGVKFVFSIEGVGCEVTGLQYNTGHSIRSPSVTQAKQIGDIYQLPHNLVTYIDYHTGCRNVSHCQQQQSYSELCSPGRSNSTFYQNSCY